jgi:hypothetical protein
MTYHSILNGGLHLVILEGKSMLNASYDVDDARRGVPGGGCEISNAMISFFPMSSFPAFPIEQPRNFKARAWREGKDEPHHSNHDNTPTSTI